MHIRPLSTKDLPEISRILAETFFPPWPDAIVQSHLEAPNTISLGIKEGAHLKGFIFLLNAHTTSEIIQFAVELKSQRQGYATRLLAEAEQHIQQQGSTEIFLEVRANNPAAFQLYQKSGFTQVGTRPDYYMTSSGRVDALVFKKTI